MKPGEVEEGADVEAPRAGAGWRSGDGDEVTVRVKGTFGVLGVEAF